MIHGLYIDASAISLKASVEKNAKLTGHLKKYLTRKCQRFCFQYFSHRILNLVERSGLRVDDMEHLESLHISLNSARTGNMMGEANPAGS